MHKNILDKLPWDISDNVNNRFYITGEDNSERREIVTEVINFLSEKGNYSAIHVLDLVGNLDIENVNYFNDSRLKDGGINPFSEIMVHEQKKHNKKIKNLSHSLNKHLFEDKLSVNALSILQNLLVDNFHFEKYGIESNFDTLLQLMKHIEQSITQLKKQYSRLCKYYYEIDRLKKTLDVEKDLDEYKKMNEKLVNLIDNSREENEQFYEKETSPIIDKIELYKIDIQKYQEHSEIKILSLIISVIETSDLSIFQKKLQNVKAGINIFDLSKSQNSSFFIENFMRHFEYSLKEKVIYDHNNGNIETFIIINGVTKELRKNMLDNFNSFWKLGVGLGYIADRPGILIEGISKLGKQIYMDFCTLDVNHIETLTLVKKSKIKKILEKRVVLQSVGYKFVCHDIESGDVIYIG